MLSSESYFLLPTSSLFLLSSIQVDCALVSELRLRIDRSDHEAAASFRGCTNALSFFDRTHGPRCGLTYTHAARFSIVLASQSTVQLRHHGWNLSNLQFGTPPSAFVHGRPESESARPSPKLEPCTLLMTPSEPKSRY